MEQLFYFFPFINQPQKIYQYHYHAIDRSKAKYCLTVQENPNFNYIPTISKNYELLLQDCGLTSDKKHSSKQMFQINFVNSSRNLMNQHNQQNLPSWTNVIITWSDNPSNYKYCVTINNRGIDLKNNIQNDLKNQSNPTESNEFLANQYEHKNMIPANYNNKFLALRKCDDLKSTNYRFAIFLLERSKMIGSPDRPGITIGTYPTWADP